MAQTEERKDRPQDQPDDLLRDAEILLRDALDRAHDAAAGLRQAEERLLQAGGPLAQMDRQRRLEDRSQRAEERVKRIEEKLRQAAEVVADLEDRRRAAEERIQQMSAAQRQNDEKLFQAEERIRDVQRSQKQADEKRRVAEERSRQTEEALTQAVEKLRQVGAHLGQLEERRKAAEERARQADERAAQVADRLGSAERRAGAVEGALAETESRVRQAEVEFRIASERLLAAENLRRGPDPEAIAQQLARFDFAPAVEGVEPELGEGSVAPEIGQESNEEEASPDLMQNLREALIRSKANAVWGPDLKWSEEAPPEPPLAHEGASIDGAAERAEPLPGDGTPSDEGELVPEPPDPPDPEATANEKPIPAPTAESPAEQAIQARAVDGERSEPSPASLEDETLSLTERELRQYAEQRSEFEERLREFWKDAEGERDEMSENQEERKLPFAGIWKRDRKT